ncbi:MAG: beta/gamma crystallin-related protein, partial [Pseudomonadota bacterium]
EGAYRGLDTDMRQLSEISFDDRARSIVINSGEWLVCDQPNYLGRCEVLSTSVKDLRRLKLSSAISSIRRYDKPAHEPDNRITRDEFRAIGLTTDYYVAPTKNGVRINYCDPDGNCGLIAANAFCVSRGHSSSRHFVADPAAEETVYVSGKPACQGKSCQALSDVLCAK